MEPHTWEPTTWKPTTLAPRPADLRPEDLRWLGRAVELSRLCPRTDSAYAVGAVMVSAGGDELAFGYSRETDPRVHAEESALAKLTDAAPSLVGATVYSSLEPCSARKSRPRTCTQLILAAGISRVIFALREPPVFVECDGVELLRAGGVEVVEIPALADAVREINAHVLGAR